MKILVLDNYDSFTYNLVMLLRDNTNNVQIDVIRNDKITLDEVARYDKILLSPGPSIPDEAGILKPLIEKYGPTKSILGICLGHQAIAEVYGAKIYNMPEVFHGYQGELIINNREECLFVQVKNNTAIGQYHSWSVEENSLPISLEVTATNTDGLIMGIRHKQYDVKGLQFHPESILTENGARYIKNWIDCLHYTNNEQ